MPPQNATPLWLPDLPRPIRNTFMCFLAATLTISFVWLGLPVPALEARIRAQLQHATGAESVTLETLAPRLSWGGPTLAARDIALRWSDGSTLDLDQIFVRPAWSLAWLHGDPVLYSELRAQDSTLKSVTRLADSPRLTGAVRAVDMARLPATKIDILRTIALRGLLDADFDLTLHGKTVQGSVSFALRDGSIAQQGGELQVPFRELRGSFSFRDSARVQIESLQIDSELLRGSLSGTIGRGTTLSSSPIDLRCEIEASDAQSRMLLGAIGIPFEANGQAKFQVGGTWRDHVFKSTRASAPASAATIPESRALVAASASASH